MEQILISHSVKTLKSEISKANIKGYSKMKKPELVKLMMQYEDRFKHIKPSVKPTPVKPTPVKPSVKTTPVKPTNPVSNPVENLKEEYKQLFREFFLNFSPEKRKKLKKSDIKDYVEKGNQMLKEINRIRDTGGFVSNEIDQVLFIKNNPELTKNFVKAHESFMRVVKLNEKMKRK